jgi:hypothetical protein
MRPIGYLLTCSLVDCAFHLKQVQLSRSTSVDQAEMQEVLDNFTNLLETLSLTVGSAQRALGALGALGRALTRENGWGMHSIDIDWISSLPALGYGPKDSLVERRGPSEVFSDFNLTETLDCLGLIPV